jgi:polyhydroxyalkanoate synthesis regulator phasin
MFANIKLGTKFTLLLSAVLIGGIIVSYLAFSQTLVQQAQDEVTSEGLLLLGMLNSVRDYTTAHVNPLLAPRLVTDAQFISESVPAFSARTVAANFRQRPGYNNILYKEASPNPTNPADKADDFEMKVFQQFQANPSPPEVSGYRDLNGTRLFFNARPLRVSSASCLACHTTPDTAPKSLIATYGTQGGFGWQLGQIIATQIVYVPAADVMNLARISVTVVMAIFLLIFVIAILAINFLLRHNVIQPIGQIAGLAHALTEGLGTTQDEISHLDDLAQRGDELGQLGRLFQKMAREVHEREERLKNQIQQMQIQIDEASKARQVAEITETEYFQQLNDKVRQLRDKSKE